MVLRHLCLLLCFTVMTTMTMTLYCPRVKPLVTHHTVTQLSNWMERLPEWKKNQTLWNLTLPASRHAGSYHLTRLDFRSQRLVVSCERFQTQGTDIYGQLLSGARYLQLNIVHDGQIWRTENVLYGLPLSHILSQLHEFLHAFPYEIVILSLTSSRREHDGRIIIENEVMIKQLVTLIHTRLERQMLIPQAVGFSLSLHDLIKNKTRCLVQIQDPDIAASDPLLWPIVPRGSVTWSIRSEIYNPLHFAQRNHRFLWQILAQKKKMVHVNLWMFDFIELISTQDMMQIIKL